MSQLTINLTRTQVDFIQRHNSPMIALSIRESCTGETKEIHTVAYRRNDGGKITLIESYKLENGEWMFSTSTETYTEKLALT
ncbi:hypothetical protein HC752_04500 [Vibrio sp. S9_S30]|uniref:hypothetical protein n=1 Tax=Vibrio sp. S9_S30 TaxID=2720226 RepID=UPI00167FFE4F|nr:hypothetical protein [Vibrio sp. S9_S30]MBD1556189.1 hypothetical protein [Vibrio sp. S9_S30]